MMSLEETPGLQGPPAGAFTSQLPTPSAVLTQRRVTPNVKRGLWSGEGSGLTLPSVPRSASGGALAEDEVASVARLRALGGMLTPKAGSAEAPRSGV